ncbi:transglutaminase family protein [Flavihumibacter profundi]|uniref:transglutaminase family protein n=1 Tax=Flavihumibacter profundi TaxID=2716883 RepID=UPI001CC791AD|nr:transglutaminase family protein [Flavihumibacter profundi]MBZ5857532.1 transglutaminase family protein [Flavihumibacter profundi]
MEYQVTHTTEYEYNNSVSLCHNMAKLLVRNTATQLCKNTEIEITPQPDILREYEDYFGNKVIYFAIQKEHRRLAVTVKSQVKKIVADKAELSFFAGTSWEQVKQQVLEPGEENFNARQYISETPVTAANEDIAAYAAQFFTPGRPFLEAANDLMQQIYLDFEFNPRFTTVATPLTEVMKFRKGVCQDFAHLAIACVRTMGLPVRYVSGYLETVAPIGKPKLTGVDASHAWFAVYVPQLGWIDFDPTNNMIPGMRHITIGWGRDYTDITPLKGVILSSGHHQLRVLVDVKRLD